MVQLTLPKNSRITSGKTWNQKGAKGRWKEFHAAQPPLPVGLVFVDHGNARGRADSVLAYAPATGTLAPVVVVHDASVNEPVYMHGADFAAYRWNYFYRMYQPHTVILCQRPLPWAEAITQEVKENA